jgi:hypothetical protein
VDDVDEMTDPNPSDSIEYQRAEIDRTRTDMAGPLDAIKDKLDPGALMDQAKEKVSETMHNVTSDVVHQAKELPHQAMDATKRAVGHAVDSAKEKMRPAVQAAGRVGGNAVDTVKSNPIPYALIGVGLGWLFLSSRRDHDHRYEGGEGHYYDASYGTSSGYQGGGYSSGYGGDYGPRTYGEEQRPMAAVREKVGAAADRIKETAGTVAERAQETAGSVAWKARQGANRAADTFQNTLESNPMAVGAAVLGLGIAFGMLLPETRTERRMMGEARERVGEKVQQVASDVGQKVSSVAKEAMSAAKDAAKDEAQNQGLAGAATGGSSTDYTA